MTLTIGSLCAGIGGLDLGLGMVLDTRLAWISEIEDAPSQILARHFPGVPNLGDLTAIDWHEVPRVDVLTAGFPCPPVSYAGLRKGFDDPRWIWPFIVDAIRVLRPRWVFIENVDGLRSLGMAGVLADLAAALYDCRGTRLRASDVGAPHGRPRVFVLAAAQDAGRVEWPAPRGRETVGPDGGGPAGVAARSGAAAENTDIESGQQRGEPAPGQAQRRAGTDGGAADDCTTCGHWDWDHDADGNCKVCGSRGCGEVWPEPAAVEDPDDDGYLPSGPDDTQWGDYEPAIRRWEAVLGRPAPAPLTVSESHVKMLALRKAGKHPKPVGMRGSLRPNWVLSADFVEWMQGYPAGWTEGHSRSKRLKALGNAVVPQQAAAALIDLLAMAAPGVPVPGKHGEEAA